MDCNVVSSMEVEPWISQGGFVVLMFAVILMFWGFAFICEEYCVPAITIFCKRNNISDDVAGAIFIGAGLSLPSMFSSFVGLFIAKSAIGVGTVIGGDVFNHLVNLSASIFVSPSKSLKLDCVILTREVFFYLGSLLLLIWSVEGNIYPAIADTFERKTWSNCLSITWVESLVLVASYGFYCIIEAYFPSILRIGLMLFQRNSNEVVRSKSCKNDVVGVSGYNVVDDDSSRGSYRDDSNVDADMNVDFEEDVEAPSAQINTEEDFANYNVEMNDFVLLKKSEFFAYNNFGCMPNCRQWQIRYCTIDENGFYYRLTYDQARTGAHIRVVNMYQAVEISVTDRARFEFSVNLRSKKKFVFRAMDLITFDRVVVKLQQFAEANKSLNDDEKDRRHKIAIQYVSGGDGTVESPESESVGETAFIVPSTPLGQCMYYSILPLKLMIYYSTPDVKKTGNEKQALLCIFMCIIWMAIESYILIVGLSSLSHMIGINDTVMGYTFGAWASSYPALWSSVVVAKFGYGDMAACNALGSNTFNNFIGLGVPWLVYILVNQGKPYSQLSDGGVVLSLILLGVILMLFYGLVGLSNWTLRNWMIPVFMLTYVIYICYLIYFSL